MKLPCHVLMIQREWKFEEETHRQWTAIHLAKLARKASRAVGKRGTDLPGQIARKVDTDILRKLAEQVDNMYLSVEQMVKQRLQT